MLSLRKSPIPIRQIEAIVLTYRRSVLADTPYEESEACLLYTSDAADE